MGSLLDELERREAEARAEAEELRGRIAELTERLAVAEERLARLVITRETVEDVLSAPVRDSSPGPAAGQPAGVVPAVPGRSPVIGVVKVPPWRADLDASVLPRDYRDLVRHEAHCHIACSAGKERRRCLWI